MAVREGKKTVEPPDWRQRHGGPRQSGQSLGSVTQSSFKVVMSTSQKKSPVSGLRAFGVWPRGFGGPA